MVQAYSAEAQALAREALAQATSESGAHIAQGIAHLVSQFTAPAVADVLAQVQHHSDMEARLLRALTQALTSTTGAAFYDDTQDLPSEAIAVYLLQRCSWDAICEPRLYDKLQQMMHGEVTAAFLAAEAQDAANARAQAGSTFAGVEDAEALVEHILAKRRLQFWDSSLQVHSAELVREAIEDNDLGRIEALLCFAPSNSAESVAQIIFDLVGPGDPVLPELRRFCNKRGINMPITLQAPPDPAHVDYMDALLQRVTWRGLRPADVQFFWKMLQTCDMELRERMLRADLDNSPAGELTMVLKELPCAQVTAAFPQAMLAQLLQTYSDRFRGPLLGFGTEFAHRLVQTLPQAQLEALVRMKEYIAIHDMLEVGQWSLLGGIVRQVGPEVASDVLKLLRAPLPPRDEHFQTEAPVLGPEDAIIASGSGFVGADDAANSDGPPGNDDDSPPQVPAHPPLRSFPSVVVSR